MQRIVGQISSGNLVDAVSRPNQDDICSSNGKKPIGNDARKLIDLSFKVNRIGDFQVVYIKNDVAVIRFKTLAKNGLTTESRQLASNQALSHWQNLDRQGEGAKYIDDFCGIDNTDEFFTRFSDNFFSRQGATATFDEMFVGRALISPIDIYRDRSGFVQIEDSNTCRP